MSGAAASPTLDWNGDSGRRWVENQDRLDRMLAAYGEALARAADPAVGDHVLDVGCGAGATTFDMAARVGPGGRVVGLDISAPLIERALDLASARGETVDFRLADAASTDFAPDFDRVVSRFGVMFFDDPVAAFANLRRALKPGGRMVFVCWRAAAENDWTRLPMGAIRDIVPPAPPPGPDAPGPFSFGDRARIERIMTEAGYADVDIRPFDSLIPFGVGDTADAALDDAVDHAIRVGPLERALKDVSDAVRAQALAAARLAFAGKLRPDGVWIDGAAWIVSARPA
ncbi:class I SAM-dependent methyltransferase [Brevundimonas sp. SORGH_AS_0993]|uniref:class I SAM-dependent methyltransferase n=1 Tax=Brevundimonas sp. SORGH_AS_0993 TaxID=3041794 RepID=UPI0027895467|nr:class I SAM-dependent methyltransferase [Brevundimonas sp. SORGH_AS_0993]MDQ1154631.1 SAM-dependent methyltransferase [Brevundimonas sp. SORGH_AS_0993]